MDGRIFASFHPDVGVGDVVMEPVEFAEGRNWLDFAGLPSHRFPLICKEQQFAEKLHAYSLPRESNSRVKDLVDMILLVDTGEMDDSRLLEAIKATFQRRDTHPIPEKLLPPPGLWEKPFSVLAMDCGLSENLGQAYARLNTFFEALINKEDE